MRYLILVFILTGCFLGTLSRPSYPHYEEENDAETEESQYEEERAEDEDANLSEERAPSPEEEDDKTHQSLYNVRNEQKTGDEDQQRTAFSEKRQKAAYGLTRRTTYEVDSKSRESDDVSDSKFSNMQMELKPRETNNAVERQVYNQPEAREIYHDSYETKQVKRYGTAGMANRKAESPENNGKVENDLFPKDEENEQTKSLNNDYDNESSDNNKREREARHYRKSEDSETHYPERSISRRDKRDANDSDHTTAAPECTSDKNDADSEDEEVAIKKHVQKLTTGEFNDLFNSLSEDKRTLLKKILGTDLDNSLENVNKREITKKAGPLDDNNLVEGNQLDSSNLQPSSLSEEYLSSTAVLSTKSTPESSTEKEASSATEKNIDGLENNFDISSASDKNTLNSVADGTDSINLQSQSKVEIKRETNSDSISLDNNVNDAKDAGYYKRDLVQNGVMVPNEFLGKDSTQDSKNDVDFFKSFKSLEESFPNSYDESGSYVGPGAGPLIRVKRKNPEVVVKKRAAALLPDAKVSYVPGTSENDEEDSNEGNEFDDNGFYDRTSNLANEDFKVSKTSDAQLHSDLPLNKITDHENDVTHVNANLESDSSVGSDTDSVISGAAEVNDNLMYNSGLRNKRTTGTAENNDISNNIQQDRIVRSTPVNDDEMETASNNYINALTYQESDAFGPLPRNYEGELGRYKRIRHVKNKPVPEELLTNN